MIEQQTLRYSTALALLQCWLWKSKRYDATCGIRYNIVTRMPVREPLHVSGYHTVVEAYYYHHATDTLYPWLIAWPGPPIFLVDRKYHAWPCLLPSLFLYSVWLLLWFLGCDRPNRIQTHGCRVCVSWAFEIGLRSGSLEAYPLAAASPELCPPCSF